MLDPMNSGPYTVIEDMGANVKNLSEIKQKGGGGMMQF